LDTPVLDDEQASLNEEVWSRGEFVRNYASRRLRPVEEVLLERYRDALAGRVLELGSGAGRLTGHLIELGGEVEGLDLAPAMVAYCRDTYPGGTFTVGDLRDLSGYAERSLDAVVATFNVIDVLGDLERRRVIADVRRVLKPGGLFVVSSHNRGYVPGTSVALRLLSGGTRRPWRSARGLPRRLRNRRRFRPLEREEPGYALINDEAHDFSVLHYYISRDAQCEQLSEEGFDTLACLDLDGNDVAEGAQAEHCPELHYVARPLG
jgi:SAM-dependent methyltransferase